jgi:hypothetical protein
MQTQQLISSHFSGKTGIICKFILEIPLPEKMLHGVSLRQNYWFLRIFRGLGENNRGKT